MIKIGILGAGHMARIHAEALTKIYGVRLVGASWASYKSLQNFRRDHNINVFDEPHELLQQVDAVIVCLPTLQHEEAVVMAAEAGVHVLCEKPISLALAACEHMFTACKKNKVIFMVAHCLRFWPEYIFLKKVIDTAKYGQLSHLELERFVGSPDWSRNLWMLDEDLSGGPAVDLHIHDADMLIHLLGRPISVSATEIHTNAFFGIEASYVYPTLKNAVYAKGGWVAGPYPFHMSWRATFDNAYIEYDSRRLPAISIYAEKRKVTHPKLIRTDGYIGELKYFIDCVKNNRQLLTASAKDARDALALVLAERKSAATGKAVHNPCK